MKKLLLIATFFLFNMNALWTQNAFKTTWETTMPNESITIYTAPSLDPMFPTTYDFTIDWGDGTPMETYSG